MIYFGDGGFIETILFGNCQTNRESSFAVVVARTTQPHELCGDGVECGVGGWGGHDAVSMVRLPIVSPDARAPGGTTMVVS